jgi:hypothetical protein
MTPSGNPGTVVDSVRGLSVMGDVARYASVLTAPPAVQGCGHDHPPQWTERNVAIGVAEYSRYGGGPELREHVWRRLGAHRGLAGVLPGDTLPLTGDSLDADRVVSAVAAGACTVREPPADTVEERLRPPRPRPPPRGPRRLAAARNLYRRQHRPDDVDRIQQPLAAR